VNQRPSAQPLDRSRTHSAAHFSALFEPRGVVVAGASTHPGKFGFVCLHNILASGYAGRVFATNRDGSPVLGHPTLRSLDELPEGAADLIFVCTPASANVELLRTAAATEGRREVERLDLWLAPYVAGHDADSVAALRDWVDRSLLDLADDPLPWFDRAAESFEQQLEVERRAPADEADASAGKLALARAAGAREAEAGSMRIVSARLGADISNLPRLQAYVARLQDREALQRARAVGVS